MLQAVKGLPIQFASSFAEQLFNILTTVLYTVSDKAYGSIQGHYHNLGTSVYN